MSDCKCGCEKEMTFEESYQCRICYVRYCEECSLDHFGLCIVDDKVKYKNIFKTMLWLIRKRILGR
jgi:hypothetical protein